MKLLIVAATSHEIDPLLSYFSFDGGFFQVKNHIVELLITGAGMVPTAFVMGQKFAQGKYDLAINLGVAGSFDPQLQIGEVLSVKQDIFADWGAADGEAFIPMDMLGLTEAIQFENNFQCEPFPLLLKNLKEVRGITVNTVHGEAQAIAKTLRRLNPQIESMEGAAFFYACHQASTPCLQIRAISNRVERRNRQNWNVALAVKHLNEWMIDFLTSSFFHTVLRKH